MFFLCNFSKEAREVIVQKEFSDRMIKQLLNSDFAKYRDLSMSRTSISGKNGSSFSFRVVGKGPVFKRPC